MLLTLHLDSETGVTKAPRGVAGSLGSPIEVAAADPVAGFGVAPKEIIFIASDGGAVVSTANPRIANGAMVGQELIVFGTDAADTLTLENGNGLFINGEIVLDDKTALHVIWDGANWRTLGRTDA